MDILEEDWRVLGFRLLVVVVVVVEPVGGTLSLGAGAEEGVVVVVGFLVRSSGWMVLCLRLLVVVASVGVAVAFLVNLGEGAEGGTEEGVVGFLVRPSEGTLPPGDELRGLVASLQQLSRMLEGDSVFEEASDLGM